MGFDWAKSDFIHVVAQSANWLRQAMCYSDHGCEVKKWVDARLLEELWCPQPQKMQSGQKHLWKDVVRGDLARLESPDALWKDTCEWRYDHEHCPRCYAKGLLARVLLGPMDWFFSCESTPPGPSRVLWVVAKLYDQLGGVNFYRTLSGMDRSDRDYRIGQLLFRIPEADYRWFKGHIADFSTLLRKAEHEKEVDYCLVLDREVRKAGNSETQAYPSGFHVYDVFPIMEILARTKAVRQLRQDLAKCTSEAVSRHLAQHILSPETLKYRLAALRRLQEGDTRVPKHLCPVDPDQPHDVDPANVACKAIERGMQVLEKYFFDISEVGSVDSCTESIPRSLAQALRTLIGQVRVQAEVEIPDNELFLAKLANYFIWLQALCTDTEHDRMLGSYTVRYASNYRLMPNANDGTSNADERIQNPCYVIASDTLPSARLLAAARVSLTHCLGPLEDYYAIQKAQKGSTDMARADIGAGMFHNIAHFTSPLLSYGERLLASEGVKKAELRAVAVRIKATTRRLARFQNAVMSLVKDVDKQPPFVALKNVFRDALVIPTVMVEAVVKDLAVFPNASLPDKERRILGCLCPTFMDLRDEVRPEQRELLHQWLKSFRSKPWLPEDPSVEQLCGWWQELFDLRIQIDGCPDSLKGPRDVIVGVLEEYLLNALTASAHSRKAWGTGVPLRIRVDTTNSAILVENFASQSLPPEKLSIRPQHDSGWGLYACQLLMKRVGGALSVVSCEHTGSWTVTLKMLLPPEKE